jgi:hypothetical protein
VTSDPALWAAQVQNSQAWHLVWRLAGGEFGVITACGIEITAAQWRRAPHFLTLGPDQQCQLCHAMAGIRARRLARGTARPAAPPPEPEDDRRSAEQPR